MKLELKLMSVILMARTVIMECVWEIDDDDNNNDSEDDRDDED